MAPDPHSATITILHPSRYYSLRRSSTPATAASPAISLKVRTIMRGLETLKGTLVFYHNAESFENVFYSVSSFVSCDGNMRALALSCSNFKYSTMKCPDKRDPEVSAALLADYKKAFSFPLLSFTLFYSFLCACKRS